MNKEEKRIIAIGASVTIVVLLLALFIFYKVDNKKMANRNTDNISVNNDPYDVLSNEYYERLKQEQEENDLREDSNVIVYLFHASYCGHCKNALKSLNENKDTTYKNIEVRTYEVDTNTENSKLMVKVAQKLNVEAKFVPFFVVGNFSTTGYNENTIISEFNKAAKNKNYQDIVDAVLKENPDLNPVYKTIK